MLLFLYLLCVHYVHHIPSCVVSWLVEDMISVISHTLSFEHGWKPVRLRNLIFGDDLVATFWLSNDELADLPMCVSIR